MSADFALVRAFARSRKVVTSALVASLAACGAIARPATLPPAPVPSKAPSSLQRLSETCAKIASCMDSSEAPRLRRPSACVEWWIAHSDPSSPQPLQACFTQATSCSQVAECMQSTGDANADAFCARRPGVFSGCDGDRLITCVDEGKQGRTVKDCASLGATCREIKAPGGLAMQACMASAKCPPGAPESQCDGESAVVFCRDGEVDRVQCRSGTRCQDRNVGRGEATASCELPSMRACQAEGTRHCEGNRLMECAEPGTAAPWLVSDCADFGLRCTGAGPRAGCSVPESVECDRNMRPTCDASGKSLVFCAAGRVTTVVCTDVGFAMCRQAPHGADASCGPATGN